VRISREVTFEAAHLLPHVPKGHKCGRLHGHSFRLVVEVSGPKDPTLGWVIDFALLDVVVKTLIWDVLDHRYLNEVAGLENPTSENIVDWCWDRLSAYGWPAGVELSCVRIEETCRSAAERRPYET
jgi:6-pyruvoyltetrahydropterin/6-carboxytetrahydropterin synthase